MFTVVETEMYRRRDRLKSNPQPAWVVWCGWKNEFSAVWLSFDEACRDAALKEATYQLATNPATAADQRSR